MLQRRNVPLCLSIRGNKCSGLDFFLAVLVLLNGAGLVGDYPGGLDHPIALAEVSPPHVLVCDLDDVGDGEPALLPVAQALALVPACKQKTGRGTEKGGGGFLWFMQQH